MDSASIGSGQSQKATTPPTACQPSTILEVDSESDWDDGLRSVTSSIVDYEFENGRRYHAYKAGHYPLPNDESELDRLDLQHHVITLLLSGELHLAPLKNPKNMLDVGTGTGLWAIEMADKFPNAVVVGTDLSPIQPQWVPDNVQFEVDDLESEWLYQENSFDYVHSRFLIGAVTDWTVFAKKAFKHLKPGGYFEIQDFDVRLTSDDGSHEKSPYHKQYTEMICEASARYGKRVPLHTEYRHFMQEAGFVDIKEYFFKIPVNSWPKDRQLKEVGKYQLLNYLEGYEGIGIGLLTRVLKWTPLEFQVLMAKTRTELKDRSVHAWQPFAVLVGRKPEEPNRQASPNSDRSIHANHGGNTSNLPEAGFTDMPPPNSRRLDANVTTNGVISSHTDINGIPATASSSS